MNPGRIKAELVSAKAGWVRRMVAGIRELPTDPDQFRADARNLAAAESYLRRALESLLDLGRHILAKGFGVAATEYRQVATGLERWGVLNRDQALLLGMLAGYRNRMVHLYNEIEAEELRLICKERLGDVEVVLGAMLAWLRANPDRVDDAL